MRDEGVHAHPAIFGRLLSIEESGGHIDQLSRNSVSSRASTQAKGIQSGREGERRVQSCRTGDAGCGENPFEAVWDARQAVCPPRMADPITSHKYGTVPLSDGDSGPIEPFRIVGPDVPDPPVQRIGVHQRFRIRLQDAKQLIGCRGPLAKPDWHSVRATITGIGLRFVKVHTTTSPPSFAVLSRPSDRTGTRRRQTRYGTGTALMQRKRG